MNEDNNLETPAEIYFGISFDDLEYGCDLYNLMCMLENQYYNGTMGKDFSYYANMYGY